MISQNEDQKLHKSKGLFRCTYMFRVCIFPPRTKERSRWFVLEVLILWLESHSTAWSRRVPNLINGWWSSSKATMDWLWYPTSSSFYNFFFLYIYIGAKQKFPAWSCKNYIYMGPQDAKMCQDKLQITEVLERDTLWASSKSLKNLQIEIQKQLCC